MAELEPFEVELDRSLRRSMAAPLPRLSSDFDARLMRALDGRSRRLGRHERTLLAVYGLVSVTASVVAMRGQGLDWTSVAVATLAPLALLAAPSLGRAINQAPSLDAGEA